MQIIFYNNLSDDDVINKSLSGVTTLTGTLKNDCSIENPEIIIENSGIVNANYVYIPEFSRYYYIDNQTILSNNRLSVSMSVDVLESFKSSILSLSCIIENSTNINDKYLPSPIWVSNVKTKTNIMSFPNGLNESGEYILITSGG